MLGTKRTIRIKEDFELSNFHCILIYNVGYVWSKTFYIGNTHFCFICFTRRFLCYLFVLFCCCYFLLKPFFTFSIWQFPFRCFYGLMYNVDKYLRMFLLRLNNLNCWNVGLGYKMFPDVISFVTNLWPMLLIV